MEKLTNNNDETILESEEENLDNNFFKISSVANLKLHIRKYQTELLVKYYDMAYLAAIVDNSFILSTPIKSYTSNNLFPEDRKLQYENDVDFVTKNNENVQKICIKLEKYVNLKSKVFDEIRQIYPNFCLKIDNKINVDQLELYKKEKQNFRYAIFKDIPYSTDTPSSEILNQLRDSLSQVIDSKSFLDACIIEDNFVLSEFEIFSNLLSNLDSVKQNAFLSERIFLTDTKSYNMQELLKKFKSELSSRLFNHLETLKLYDKISSTKEIKLVLKSEDLDDESVDR